MKIYNLILILLFCSLFIDCKKETSEQNPDFIGNWKGTFGQGNSCIMTFDLDNNSQAKFFSGCVDCCKVEFEGKSKLKGNILTIKTHRFKILQQPEKINDSTWTCRIQTPPLYGKYESTLYKNDN